MFFQPRSSSIIGFVKYCSSKQFQYRLLSSVKNDGKGTAIVLLNMGGPKGQENVNSFLLNLFADKDLIPLPFHSVLGKWIANRRTPKIKEQYQEIGGGSPITHYTSEQARLLAEKLDKECPESAPHKPYIAFRYADPLTKETVEKIKADGLSRAVAFSCYPQYSCSTTGSSLNELVRVVKEADPGNSIKWSVVDRWHSHPGLAKVFAKNIKDKLKSFAEPSKVRLLFSAHSLPMTVVNRGDTYPMEVASTVNEVMKELNHSNPYRLIWQSQVGPQPWLGPKTEDVVKDAKEGEQLLVIPIAFVSDHIETLFEVDIEYAEIAKEKKLHFERAESLNTDPAFIDTMVDIVKNHLKSEDPMKLSAQMSSRCPSCTNPKCGTTRDFLSSQ